MRPSGLAQGNYPPNHPATRPNLTRSKSFKCNTYNPHVTADSKKLTKNRGRGYPHLTAGTQQLPSNDHPLYLAGPLVNRNHPRIPVHPLDIRLPRIPRTPMNLDRLSHHPVDHFARVELGLGRSRPQLPRVRILKPCSMIDEPARRLDPRLNIRHHPLYGLELADSLAKGAPLLGVLHGLVEGALDETQSHRRNSNSSAVQGTERNLQPLPFFAQAVLARHFAIVQQNLNGRRTPLPHFVFMPADLKSRKPRLNEKR